MSGPLRAGDELWGIANGHIDEIPNADGSLTIRLTCSVTFTPPEGFGVLDQEMGSARLRDGQFGLRVAQQMQTEWLGEGWIGLHKFNGPAL